MTTAALPPLFETFTPERLTQVLYKAGVPVNGRVRGVSAAAIGAEAGFLDCVARLTLTYDRPQAAAPASVVVKVSSADPTYRRIGEFYDAYEREFHFYEAVAPDAPIRLPRCYARQIDAATGAHILVLEDLRELTPGDEAAGLTPEQAAAAVESIGRMHARWWNSPRLDALTWMPRRNFRAARYQAMWPKFREQIAPRLPPAATALGDYLGERLDGLLDEMDRRPTTIVHSDFRADNLLFDDGLFEGGAERDPVVVLDWQLAIRGAGIMDVARLLCGSLSPVDRAANETPLVRLWQETLARGGVRDYDFEQAWADYRAAVLLCLYYPVTIHEAEEAAGRRGTALAAAQIERYFAAAELHCSDVIALGAQA